MLDLSVADMLAFLAFMWLIDSLSNFALAFEVRKLLRTFEDEDEDEDEAKRPPGLTPTLC